MPSNKGRRLFSFLRDPMKWLCPVLFCAANIAHAEVRVLTLRQALEIALRQNPDILLARLDELHAREQIQVAQDPFRPKIEAGSDAVYTSGYPNSINGESPHILGARTNMAFYNRPQRYEVAETKVQANAAQFSREAKEDDVAYRVTTLFLDAQECAGEVERLKNQLSSAATIARAVNSRIEAGYELPMEETRAGIEVAQSQERLDASRSDQIYAEDQLAIALGFSAADSVRPIESAEDVNLPPVKSETEAVELAFQRNKALAQLQSALIAKQIEIASAKATRFPQIDLVAQYSMLRKRDYEDYFPARFVQRNNGQIGASVAIALLLGPAPGGHLHQSQIDFLKLRIQIDQLRNQIASGVHRSYQGLQKAQGALQLARQELDLAASELEVRTAQYAEGRALLSKVETARLSNSEHSLSVWQEKVKIKRAQLNILRQSGDLMSMLLQTSSRP